MVRFRVYYERPTGFAYKLGVTGREREEPNVRIFGRRNLVNGGTIKGDGMKGFAGEGRCGNQEFCVAILSVRCLSDSQAQMHALFKSSQQWDSAFFPFNSGLSSQ